MSDFDARFEAVKKRFASKAGQEATQLQQLRDSGDWHGVRDIAHGLAGRAGMFGHGDLGELARAVEEGIESGHEPSERLTDLIACLQALAQER